MDTKQKAARLTLRLLPVAAIKQCRKHVAQPDSLRRRFAPRSSQVSSALCGREALMASKRIRSIGSLAAELVSKSRESALCAIRVFNDPHVSFKSETSIHHSSVGCATGRIRVIMKCPTRRSSRSASPTAELSRGALQQKTAHDLHRLLPRPSLRNVG